MSGGDSTSKSFGEVPKLLGKETYVRWSQRITLALSLTRSSSFVVPSATFPYPVDSSIIPLPVDQARANADWIDRDHQIAAAILSTTDESILTAHIHLLGVNTGRAQAVYLELVRFYGNTGAQYSFALGRKFIDNKCKGGEDVEAWVNEVQAQYRELKFLSFDLDALCVNVMLNGLPERFASFVDGVWTSSENPSIEDVRVAVLRINAGQMNRTNDKALAAKLSGLEMLSGESELKAFYAGLRKAGKGPSKEHPCARCQSHEHWVVDCPRPPTTNEGSGWKARKGKKRTGRKASAQAAISNTPSTLSTDPTALIAHSSLTSFNDKSEISHLLLTLEEVTSVAVHSSHWILDSGASESMTGDRAWFESIQPMGSTVRIATAGGTSLASDSAGPVHLSNHKGERVVLGRVLYVPGLAFNLLSVSRLDSAGAEIVFSNSLCKVTKGGSEVLRADLEHKVWVIKGTQWKANFQAFNGMVRSLPAVIEPTSKELVSKGILPSKTKASWDLWHRRLAHLGVDSMKLLFGGLSTGSSIARTNPPSSNEARSCEGCVMGKIVRPAFHSSSSHAKAILDLVHTDLCGPMGVKSMGPLNM